MSGCFPTLPNSGQWQQVARLSGRASPNTTHGFFQLGIWTRVEESTMCGDQFQNNFLRPRPTVFTRDRRRSQNTTENVLLRE